MFVIIILFLKMDWIVFNELFVPCFTKAWFRIWVPSVWCTVGLVVLLLHSQIVLGTNNRLCISWYIAFKCYVLFACCKCFFKANGRPRVNCCGCFSTKACDPSKAHYSQDNVHPAASVLSLLTDGISSRQHIMYMYTYLR